VAVLLAGVHGLLGADLSDHEAKLRRLQRALVGRPLPDPRWLFAVSVEPPSSLREDAWEAEDEDAGRVGARAERGPARRLCSTLQLMPRCWALTPVPGLALLAWGWRVASTSADLDRAWDGLALGIVGLLCCAVGFSLAIGSRRRGVVSKKVVALERISTFAVASFGARDVQPDGEDDARWTAPGLRRFHRRDCPALRSATGAPHAVTTSSGELDACLLCHREA
jgi:hypothetical protein